MFMALNNFFTHLVLLTFFNENTIRVKEGYLLANIYLYIMDTVIKNAHKIRVNLLIQLVSLVFLKTTYSYVCGYNINLRVLIS